VTGIIETVEDAIAHTIRDERREEREDGSESI
jgi:hypothetical protein